MTNENRPPSEKPLMTVVLKHPVTFGTEVYKVLEFRRRLKARDGV